MQSELEEKVEQTATKDAKISELEYAKNELEMKLVPDFERALKQMRNMFDASVLSDGDIQA